MAEPLMDFSLVSVTMAVSETSRLSRITFRPTGKPTVPLKEPIITPIVGGI